MAITTVRPERSDAEASRSRRTPFKFSDRLLAARLGDVPVEADLIARPREWHAPGAGQDVRPLTPSFPGSRFRPVHPFPARAAALLALLAALVFAAPVAAQSPADVTLVSNTGQAADNPWDSSLQADYLQRFTTGGASGGYKLTGVDVDLIAVGATPATYSLKIVTSDGARPVGTLANPASLAEGLNRHEASGDGIDLAADTTYAVFLDVTADPSATDHLGKTNSNAEDAGVWPGWSISDSLEVRSWHSGSSWSPGYIALKIAVHGRAKDTTAPELRSARVDGAALKLDYDERLDPGSTPATTDYTVTVEGAARNPTNVVVSGDAVTLTLGTAVTAGQTVTVSYTAGTNPIRNHALIDAGDLSGRSVTNTTQVTKPAVTAVAMVSLPSRDMDGNGTPETYAGGEEIRVRLTFDRAVTVDTDGGKPRLKIRMAPDAGVKWAHYDGGSGTTMLTFVYTVVKPSVSTRGVAVLKNSLALNGGMIVSTATKADASLTHTGLGHDADHKVDWQAGLLRLVEGTVDFSSRGATVRLYFSESLDTTQAAPAVTQFKLSRNLGTVRNLAISGNRITIETDYDRNVLVKVRISISDTSGIQGSSGSKLEPVTEFNLANNAWPNAGAPHLGGAVATGDRLTLNYNQPLHRGAVPPASNFTVKGTANATSVNAVAISGDSVVLTLHPPVEHGNTGITVRYAKTTAPFTQNKWRLQAGGANRTVTNNTPNRSPMFRSAAVSGNTLTVTFTETLDRASPPAGVRFRLAATPARGGAATNVFGSGTATISGDEVTVTLQRAIGHGETATVAYTAGSEADPLRDTASTPNKVADFTGQAVTINTPPAPAGATVDGATLTLAFDGALDMAAAPAAARFAVAGTGTPTTVTDVVFRSADATTTMVELTLSPAVTRGDAGITVGYAGGGDANRLKDADNAMNAVADFTGQAVANNTRGAATPYALVSNTGRAGAVTVAFDVDTAQAFTTGGHTHGYKLTGVDVYIRSTARTPPVYAVKLHDDSSGAPGAVLDTLANPASLTAVNRLHRFTATGGGIDLAAGTKYWVVVDSSTGSEDSRSRILLADSGAEDATGAAGWSIGDGLRWRHRSSTTWTNTQRRSVKLAIHGEAKPDPALAVFLSAAVNGDELAVAFGEDLDPDSRPAGSVFTVTAQAPGEPARTIPGSGSQVTVSGGTAKATLTSAVAHGESVFVLLDQSGHAGVKLRGAGGKAVADLDTGVTNNTPPAPAGATVNGSRLTIAFDGELDTAAPPEAARFTVAGTDNSPTTARVVRFKRGDATRVELTLSPAVAHGDAGITVSYTAGDNANPLKDADNANEAVADFAGLEVTNRTPDPARPPQPSPAPSFGGAAVAALTLDRGRAMAPVVLPRATGGDGALAYSLTSAPAGLAGLDFDAATRRLSGTPGTSGRWTFTYRAEDADADRTDSDAAVLTFEVTVTVMARAKAAVKRTLSGVATRTLSSALGHIGLRLGNVVPAGGLTLAGRRLEFAPPGMGAGGCAWGGSDRHGMDRHGMDRHGFDRYGFNRHGLDRHGVGDAGWAGLGSGGGCAGWSRGIGTDELLGASAFSWLLGAAEGSGGADPAAARWAVWGRGDFSDFAGRPEGMSYDGKARSGWLGVDARKDRWVAGLALSHGVSEADYSYEGGAAGGRLETTLTALYPYGRWTLAEGLEVRGVLGAGSGEARHMPGDAEAATSDLTMRMGSAGVRRELLEVAGIELAARADASVVRMEIEAGPEFIDGVSADSWRARVGLEATRRLALGEETALTPFMEVTGRRDGGDGLEGSGLEVAGGVRYTAPRVEVEARGRLLATHAEEGARERGVSVTARLGPGADGRGLSLSLRPRWGTGTGGAEALWRDELPGLSGAGDRTAFDARIGYGVGLAERGLLTPFLEAGVSESRRLRVGTRFDGWRADLGLELSGERREDGNGEAEHGVLLDLRLRF